MVKHIHLKNRMLLFNHLAKRTTRLSGLAWFACIAWLSPSFSLAQVSVAPEQVVFKPRQVHTMSEERSIMVSNQGESNLIISPENIQLVAAGPQSTELSVLTYNLWFDTQNWPARFVHMLREIRQLDPDIIGLQEVIQRPQLDNQAHTLADSLGYHYYTFSSRDAETATTRFGNAIVSRYPIEETNWRALKPLSDFRTAVHARINVAGNIIDFYNTHLHNAAVNVHIREEQILDLLDFIEETSAGGMMFVTGDFNANPDWQEMDLMYHDFQDVYPIFHDNHLDPEHGTLNHHLGHQQRRIDYIFFGKNKAHKLDPTSARVVLDTPSEAGIWGSDHFGVFASFAIRSDADAFILENIHTEIKLNPSDSIRLGIRFAPFTTKSHHAIVRILDQQVHSRGEGFDATIHDFPWAESFGGTASGTLPMGWEANTSLWETRSTSFAGGLAPEMVLTASPHVHDTLLVISPPIQTRGIDSLSLSFKHHTRLHAEQDTVRLRVAVLADEQTYPVQTWTVTGGSITQDAGVNLHSALHGTGQGTIRLAWAFTGNHVDSAFWHIDDVSLVALPALAVDPWSHHFEPQRVHTTSEPFTFELKNIGGGEIVFTPPDIRLTGQNPDAFTTTLLSDSIILSGTKTARIQVAFNPTRTGEKQAMLHLGPNQIPLSGFGFDPTIRQLPWSEDFSGLPGGGLPLGWTSNSDHWGAFNASHAGGEAPEMVFWWQPETTGRFYLTTPEVITTGLDSLVLSFRHRIRNFREPGTYTLSVISMTDDGEYLIHEWVNPDLTPATEFITLIESVNHGVGQSPFQLAWVFDGITDNITQWDIDDIHLSVLEQSPIPIITPDSIGFGRQTIETSSERQTLTLKNTGGRNLTLTAGEVHITGPDAPNFIMDELPEVTTIAPFEDLKIAIRFLPLSAGEKHGELIFHDLAVPLTGTGTEVVPYFIYSDFTIADNGRQYTNVEGFREVPAFARNGSIIANDLANQGEFGGTVLQLAYNLTLADDFTIYYMWAFPHADISGHDHIVIYARASEPVTNVRLQMQDTSGVQGTDGASYAWFDIGTDWEKTTIPVSDMTKMPWANNHPDMSRIQKIDLVFEKNATQPAEAIVCIDLVGFDIVPVSARVTEKEPAVRVFPNPASGAIHVMAEPGAQIALFDLAGRAIKQELTRSHLTRIGLTGLTNGLYLLRISMGDDVINQKISVY